MPPPQCWHGTPQVCSADELGRYEETHVARAQSICSGEAERDRCPSHAEGLLESCCSLQWERVWDAQRRLANSSDRCVRCLGSGYSEVRVAYDASSIEAIFYLTREYEPAPFVLWQCRYARRAQNALNALRREPRTPCHHISSHGHGDL